MNRKIDKAIGIVFFLIVSIISLVVAFLPEIVMYFLYNLIDPSTFLERMVVIGLFLLTGGPISVFFAFLGLRLWVSFIEAM